MKPKKKDNYNMKIGIKQERYKINVMNAETTGQSIATFHILAFSEKQAKNIAKRIEKYFKYGYLQVDTIVEPLPMPIVTDLYYSAERY